MQGGLTICRTMVKWEQLGDNLAAWHMYYKEHINTLICLHDMYLHDEPSPRLYSSYQLI